MAGWEEAFRRFPRDEYRHVGASSDGRDIGVEVVQPVEKMLVCGDIGMGAMACPAYIASRVSDSLLKLYIPQVSPRLRGVSNR